jgi:outer membrane receptor protein involved in Fe transport
VDITFGARYTYEKKELEQTHNLRIPWTSIGLGELYNINPSRSENDFSPSVDLRWRPYDDVNLYASVRRGYRGGGFDRFLFSFSQAEAEANVEFDSENVIAYEIGAKLELLDNTLRLNAALFRSEYDDLQVSTFISATQFRVFNAASATSQGLELSMHWQPNERFSMSADLGLLDAEYTDFPNAACYTGQTAAEGCTPLGQDLSGKTLEHAPDVQATVAGTYIWPIGGNLQLALHGQLSHSAASFQGIDLHPAKKQESYQLLSGRLGLSNADETWEVAIIGRNLTDELVFGYTSNSSPDGIDGFLLEPRVVGVQGTYRF